MINLSTFDKRWPYPEGPKPGPLSRPMFAKPSDGPI